MPTEKNVFRKLDTDSSPLQMPAGAALDMLNVTVTETGCYNVKGNTVRFGLGVLWSCTGAFEDKQHDSVLFFFTAFISGNNIGRLYRYWPGTKNTVLVLEHSVLATGAKFAVLVDDLLTWTDGEGELHQINLTRKTFYDSIKATTPHFANLLKAPPVRPLEVRDALNSGISIGAAGLKPTETGWQFTWRYVYIDGQKSVFAPFTNLYFQEEFLIGINETIPLDVARVEFGFRRNNAGPVSIFASDTRANVQDITYRLIFNATGYTTGEVVADADALRLFDAVPTDVKALAIARNRIFLANYTEGYDYFDSLEMVITPTKVAASTLSSGQRIFKGRNKIQFGIVPKDWAGRTFGAITKPEWLLETDEVFETGYANVTTTVNVAVTGSMPAWVTGYEVVRTRNLRESFFIQGVGYLAFKLSGFENAEQIIQRYDPLNIKADSYRSTMVEIKTLGWRGVGYTYEPGDRINIYYLNRETNTIVPRYNLRILSQQGSLLEIESIDEPGFSHLNEYIYPNPDSSYNSDAGVTFEIYRPYVGAEREPFYSIGIRQSATGGTINHNFTVYGDAYHLTNSFVNDGMLNTASLLDENGNQYNYSFTVPAIGVQWPYLQAMSPFDRYYNNWFTDIGQPFLHLPESKRVHKASYERFSNKYLSGTQINGLSTFEALNEKQLPLENGAINALVLASNTQAEGTVLLAIQQNETESQYLGEVQFRDTQGNTTVAISEQVVGSTNTLRGGYGTINPESVVQVNGNVYFWDATSGEPIRYGANGNVPLATTGNMRAFFTEQARKQRELANQPVGFNQGKVFGGFDPATQEYIMHFAPIYDQNNYQQLLFGGFTIAYSERLKAFTTRYSFDGTPMVKSNTQFYSFKDGEMWEHGTNPLCNNFYGVQHKSSIRFISNQEPSQVKIWSAIAIEGQTVWVPKELKNEMGQASEMKAAWFQQREGMFYGAMRRDYAGKTGDEAIRALNNGKPLRSAYLDILLENESTELTRLDAVNVIYIASSGHSTIN